MKTDGGGGFAGHKTNDRPEYFVRAVIMKCNGKGSYCLKFGNFHCFHFSISKLYTNHVNA